MRNRIAINGAMVGLMISISTSTAQASEVWVQQARGRISGGTSVAEENKPANTAPEGGSTNAAASGSPTNPATCNQQNASSPACYSATAADKKQMTHCREPFARHDVYSGKGKTEACNVVETQVIKRSART